MKTIASLIFAMTLAASHAADEFPKAGETYRIQAATALADTPYENRVTILEVGQNGWAKVQYEKMTLSRDGGAAKQTAEKHEMWVNFNHITSAVKTTAAAAPAAVPAK